MAVRAWASGGCQSPRSNSTASTVSAAQVIATIQNDSVSSGTGMGSRRKSCVPRAQLAAETSAATLTLFLISMWVLAIIARPYTWWRVILVASMAVAFLLVLVVPALQDFFAVRLVGLAMPWTAVAVSVLAAAALEFLWKWVDRRFPG